MTSATAPLRVSAKEKLRQELLDKRFAKKLARAEATLQRLLDPVGLSQKAIFLPEHPAALQSTTELGYEGLLLSDDGVSTEAGSGGDRGSDSAAALVSAPTAVAESPRSSVLSATAPVAAPTDPSVESSALAGRRQEKAVIMAAEARLLGVMSGSAP